MQEEALSRSSEMEEDVGEKRGRRWVGLAIPLVAVMAYWTAEPGAAAWAALGVLVLGIALAAWDQRRERA
jgi:hypothetical protein